MKYTRLLKPFQEGYQPVLFSEFRNIKEKVLQHLSWLVWKKAHACLPVNKKSGYENDYMKIRHVLTTTLFFAFSFVTVCNSETFSIPVIQKIAQESAVACNAKQDPTGKNIVYLDLKSGCVVIKLLPDLAPNHVRRIKTLVKKEFYNDLSFHRVIDGFMAQTGDPEGTGQGGSDLPDLKAEFSGESFRRGVLGMARAQDLNSANSQFFIMFSSGDFLNGKYTVFGKVIKGMENMDVIKRGDATNNGMVMNPDRIIRMRMALTP